MHLGLLCMTTRGIRIEEEKKLRKKRRFKHQNASQRLGEKLKQAKIAD